MFVAVRPARGGPAALAKFSECLLDELRGGEAEGGVVEGVEGGVEGGVVEVEGVEAVEDVEQGRLVLSRVSPESRRSGRVPLLLEVMSGM